MTGDDDTVKLYHASNPNRYPWVNFSRCGGGDFTYDIDLSEDGSMAAIAIGRSGWGGTSGVVRVIDTSNANVLQNLNPGSEDRFHSVDFGQMGASNWYRW